MTPKDLICDKCKNFTPLLGGCTAFKKGIPDEIIAGENDHSKPLPNQGNNIVFEEIK